jgi:hypothetical protein
VWSRGKPERLGVHDHRCLWCLSRCERAWVHADAWGRCRGVKNERVGRVGQPQASVEML